MRIWHDDIRPPPEGWVWARTNDEAKKLLQENDVEEISLDHDLGLHELDPYGDPELIFFPGRSQHGTGLDLVHWMVEDANRVPAKVTIHSWNPVGAESMASRLNHAGHDCLVAPYIAPREE